MTKRFITIASGFLLLLAGCKEKGCLDSSGTQTTTVRPAGTISEIDAPTTILLSCLRKTAWKPSPLKRATTCNRLSKTDNSNNILTLSNNSGCSWLKGASENMHGLYRSKRLATAYPQWLRQHNYLHQCTYQSEPVCNGQRGGFAGDAEYRNAAAHAGHYQRKTRSTRPAVLPIMPRCTAWQKGNDEPAGAACLAGHGSRPAQHPRRVCVQVTRTA